MKRCPNVYAINGQAPDDAVRFVARVKKAARTGAKISYSREMAEIIEAHAGPTPPPVTVIAGDWARAGEIDKAFDILEKGYLAARRCVTDIEKRATRSFEIRSAL